MISQVQFVQAAPGGNPEYNSSGFRCKEFEDIDLDNYCLFAGCSHTEGVGVANDETFAHLVSEKLKCDCVNLAVGGGGIDAVEHNLLAWFMYTDKKPKALVIEWPIYQRYIKDIHGQKNLCPAGAWSNPKFVTYADDPLYIKGELTYHFLHRIMPVKIIDVMHGSISQYTWNSSMIWHERLDKGTDGGHGGPKSHIATAENIHNAIIR